jgi:hypothetical protein
MSSQPRNVIDMAATLATAKASPPPSRSASRSHLEKLAEIDAVLARSPDATLPSARMTGSRAFQRVDGLGICNTIAARRAIVHLKGANDGLRPAIKLVTLPNA